MSYDYVYGDIANHAQDVRDGAARLLHELEAVERGRDIEVRTVRENIDWIAKYAGRLQSDLSQLNFQIEAKRAEDARKLESQPATPPLPLEGGAK